MAKRKNHLRDLQIKAAEEGNQPESLAETYASEQDATSGMTPEEQAKAKADRKKQALDEASAEELENAAANKRQIEKQEENRRKRKPSLVDRGRDALRILTGK